MLVNRKFNLAFSKKHNSYNHIVYKKQMKFGCVCLFGVHLLMRK